MLQLAASILLVATLAASGDAVRGLVLDPEGQPTAGALVFFLEQGLEGQRIRTTRSGQDGAFRFTGQSWPLAAHTVLAYKEGFALTGTRLVPPSSGLSNSRSAQSVRIHLKRPQPIRVRILDPQGRAASGVDVALTAVAHGKLYVDCPRLFTQHFRLQADAAGLIRIPFLSPQTRFGLRVASSRYGIQEFSLQNDGKSKYVRLRAVGSLAGVVVADDPRAIRNVRMWVQSAERFPIRQGNPGRGLAEVRTDAQGRFRVPAIAAGQFTLRVRPPKDPPFFAPDDVTTTVTPGKQTFVRIQLTRGVPFSGHVVDAESGDPIPGVTLRVGPRLVTTDTRGRFRTYARPGRVELSVLYVPQGGLSPSPALRVETVPETAASYEAAPIRLKPASLVRGVVLDEHGRPVPGAQVQALWLKTDGHFFTVGKKGTVSDAEGRFVLTNLPGDVELSLSAASEARATERSVRVTPGPDRTVRLTVTTKALATMVDRVVDEQGNPVPDASVRIYKSLTEPSVGVVPAGSGWDWREVRFEKQLDLSTDFAGFYRTPCKLLRNHKYRVNVTATGLVPFLSKPIQPAEAGDPVWFPDVVLLREAAVRGTVVDTSGRPIDGATVWSYGCSDQATVRRAAQTDADGRFRLDGLHPESRFVLAMKEGYRLSGAVVPASGQPVRVTLLRVDQRPPRPPLRPIHWTQERQRRLLRELLLPVYSALSGPENERLRVEVLKRLAPFDRRWCLSELEKLRSERHRVDVLVALNELEEALESARVIEDSYRRVQGFVAVADASVNLERRRSALAEALLAARTVRGPAFRAQALAGIAQRLYELGDRDGAKRVAMEASALATHLPTTDAAIAIAARGKVATALAVFDSAAALKLVEHLDDYFAAQYMGEMAAQLAAVDPAESERLLEMMPGDYFVTPYQVPVCDRMARVDLERARHIADRLEVTHSVAAKAHAYGAMAVAMVKKDREVARELLQTAVDQFPTAWKRDPPFGQLFAVAVALLHFSETVAPDRTREYLWYALSVDPGLQWVLHRPFASLTQVAQDLSVHPGLQWVLHDADDDWQQRRENARAQLVVLLGLYGQFPELQREWMDPIFKRWSRPDRNLVPLSWGKEAVLAAMALSDPERTVAWHKEFYPRLGAEDRRAVPQPWMTIADVFSHSGIELSKTISRKAFSLWVMDKED